MLSHYNPTGIEFRSSSFLGRRFGESRMTDFAIVEAPSVLGLFPGGVEGWPAP